jgi:hypothetical protein
MTTEEKEFNETLILVEKDKYYFLIQELQRLDSLIKLYHDHYKIMQRHFNNVNQIVDAMANDDNDNANTRTDTLQ